jgi:hypothetical protein
LWRQDHSKSNKFGGHKNYKSQRAHLNRMLYLLYTSGMVCFTKCPAFLSDSIKEL